MIGMLVSDGGPDSVWAVVIKVPSTENEKASQQSVELCSGTLVSGNEIRTAAHCVTQSDGSLYPDGSVLKVGCGYVGGEKPFKEIRYAKSFALSAKRVAAKSEGDSASIILNTPISEVSIQPIEVARELAEVRDLLEDSIDCRMFGYGDSEKGDYSLKNGINAFPWIPFSSGTGTNRSVERGNRLGGI